MGEKAHSKTIREEMAWCIQQLITLYFNVLFLYKGDRCMRVKYQLVGRNYGKYLGKQNKMTL